MRRTAKINPERPPAVAYDLNTLPALNKTCEAIRAEIAEYVDYMAAARRKPSTIHLKPGQLESLRRGINAKLDKVAPPLGDLMFRGIPVASIRTEAPHAS